MTSLLSSIGGHTFRTFRWWYDCICQTITRLSESQIKKGAWVEDLFATTDVERLDVRESYYDVPLKQVMTRMLRLLWRVRSFGLYLNVPDVQIDSTGHAFETPITMNWVGFGDLNRSRATDMLAGDWSLRTLMRHTSTWGCRLVQQTSSPYPPDCTFQTDLFLSRPANPDLEWSLVFDDGKDRLTLDALCDMSLRCLSNDHCTGLTHEPCEHYQFWDLWEMLSDRSQVNQLEWLRALLRLEEA